MNETSCDVAIIGGGPVGAALAIALQGNDLNVVLLEARETEINTTDPRALALSYGTRLLLQRSACVGCDTEYQRHQNHRGDAEEFARPYHPACRRVEGSGNGLCVALHCPARRVATGVAANGYHLFVRRSGQRLAQLEREHHPNLSIPGKRTQTRRAPRRRRRRRQIARGIAPAADSGLWAKRHHRPCHQLATRNRQGFRAFHRARTHGTVAVSGRIRTGIDRGTRQGRGNVDVG